VSGYVEASNVNLIEEMMALIDLSHTYNDDTKVVNNRETMLTKMMDIGRTAQ
jgi:flagellar basal body rod protein FlgC